MARIDDGHPTTIDFLGPSGEGGEQEIVIAGIAQPVLVDFDIAGVVIWEKSVTPPGLQGGGGNDISTMRSTRWRQMAPKHLMTLSEMSCTFAYDSAVYVNLVYFIQVNQLVKVNFPDGSALTFWGFLDDLSPNEVSEGEQAEADGTVIPTNFDLSGDEIAPSYSAVGS